MDAWVVHFTLGWNSRGLRGCRGSGPMTCALDRVQRHRTWVHSARNSLQQWRRRVLVRSKESDRGTSLSGWGFRGRRTQRVVVMATKRPCPRCCPDSGQPESRTPSSLPRITQLSWILPAVLTIGELHSNAASNGKDTFPLPTGSMSFH